MSSELIKIIHFKTSHLRLRRNSFFVLAETLTAQDFQSSCACACGATFMTCAAHLCLYYLVNCDAKERFQSHTWLFYANKNYQLAFAYESDSGTEDAANTYGKKLLQVHLWNSLYFPSSTWKHSFPIILPMMLLCKRGSGMIELQEAVNHLILIKLISLFRT